MSSLLSGRYSAVKVRKKLYVTVTTKAGRKIKVYAAGSTLEDLRAWFKQGAKVRSTVDRAEDALEATV